MYAAFGRDYAWQHITHESVKVQLLIVSELEHAFRYQ